MIKLTVSEWIDKFREQPDDSLVYIYGGLGGEAVVLVEPPGGKKMIFYDTETGFID